MNGSIFFYALNGDGSLEWLGSAMIWLLLALSVANVVLIVHGVATHARESILPARASAELADLLAAGRYKDAIERADRGRDDFSRMLSRALSCAPQGADAMLRAAEQSADELLAAAQEQTDCALDARAEVEVWAKAFADDLRERVTETSVPMPSLCVSVKVPGFDDPVSIVLNERAVAAAFAHCRRDDAESPGLPANLLRVDGLV